jgi:hypothetical protein
VQAKKKPLRKFYCLAKVIFSQNIYILVRFLDGTTYTNLRYTKVARKFILLVMYKQNGLVKEDETGGTCSKNGKKRNAYRLFDGKNQKESDHWEDQY